MRKLRVLDLFSGIGGFSLGLERAGGFETVAFCEIEPYPRAVLAKHWPHVPCYEDVRTLTADALRRDGIAVDVICGGFPCQDISVDGDGAGITGPRSGLWFEYARLVGELRPRFVIVENVAELLARGLGEVVGSLAAIGYDAEWHCIRASRVGLPHHRDRICLLPTPMANDFKGGCKTGRLSELKHFLLIKFGMKYPPVSLLTKMMGFPDEWCGIKAHRKPSATPSSLKSPRSSAVRSSKRKG